MSPTHTYIEHPLIWNRTIEFRQYQKNIADSATNRNTLVILPTALGKTIISVLMCVDVLYKYRDKRVLVMAPTRPLVGQHLKLFSSVLKILEEQIASVTGKTPPEYRGAVWSKKEVRLVFATPEIVKNDLSEGRLQFRGFSLLVFDEAHKAVKDYSYTSIAREYTSQAPCPMILALTASPGAERKRVQEVCDNLFIENIEYRNEDDLDVKPYINPIDVKWEWFSLSEEHRYIASTLRSMLHERLRWLIQRGVLKKRSVEWVFKRDLISLGEELRYTIELTMAEQRALLYAALSNQSTALTLMYCLELIESQGAFSLKAFLNRIEQQETGKTHPALLKHPNIIEIRTLLDNVTNEGPKIRYLLERVMNKGDCYQIPKNNNENSEYQEDNRRSKILIFTQYRDTARHIVEILSRNNISTCRFVGQAKRMGDEGMTQEKQEQVLEEFRRGDFQVLVATSIAEEGLDIPEVDLVVFYEPIPSEIRYIQRRGRTGRNSPGMVIILAMKDSVDARYLNASSRRVEKMKDSLISIKSTIRPLQRRVQLQFDPMTSNELSILNKRNKRFEDLLSETVRLEVSQGILPEKNVNKRLQELSKNRRINSLAVEAELLTGKFRRHVDKTARRVYIELQKYGRHGTDMEMLSESLGIENIIMIEAIKKLEKLRKVEWLDEATVASTNLRYKQPLGKTLDLYVEKVVQGKALVLVDGKWHARLNHYDYEGPREFLKKGFKFKAIGEMYREEGVLNIKIKQIIGVT
jgi:ERCC4-related helicase